MIKPGRALNGRPIPVAEYLFRRLRQHGVQHVFGVPGDFMLKALDSVKASGSKWIGNCNELNAGYAADGYARINGLGALFTTYGVGELSAINAIAGSYAEHVPVVHIIGTPSKKSFDSGRLVHHSLEVTRRPVFESMHKFVTEQTTCLDTPSEAPYKINDTIHKALVASRPAYIQMPCDVATQLCKPNMLEQSCEVENSSMPLSTNVIGLIQEQLMLSKTPLLLIDRGMGVERFREPLNDLVRVSRLPTLTMPSGASMIDHALPNYYGVHAGAVGQVDTTPYVQASDLVLAFGPMFSDTQTVGWSVVPSTTKTLTIGRDRVQLPGQTDWHHVDTNSLLQCLIQFCGSLQPSMADTSTLSNPNFREVRHATKTKDTPIDQTNLYLYMNRYLKPHDIVLLGNATPILGGRDFVLPDLTCKVIVSGQWFSIGQMLPEALGAAIAHQGCFPGGKSKGRVVLFDGDGSFQVTAQELSTIIRLRLNMTIVLVNNNGYAYERLIHNRNADYHDVAPWDYSHIIKAFGSEKALQKAQELGENYSVAYMEVRTWRDLDKLLESECFDNGYNGRGTRGLKFVNLIIGETDVPEKFKQVFESAGRNLG